MKAALRSALTVASLICWFSITSARSLGITAGASGDPAALIANSVHYYAYGGDPQAVMITVSVYDNYQGDFNKYHWIYEVVNNSYNPSCYPFASNGFSGFLLYLDFIDPNEIGNIQSPGPGWVIGAQWPLPMNWDIVEANGIMPGESGTFSFTTSPRYTATTEGYFNTRCFGIPVKAVNFTTSDGPEGPGALKPAGPCYVNGSCQTMQEGLCNSVGGQFCSTPKALLAAWPKTANDKKWMSRNLSLAQLKLWWRGWTNVRLPMNTPWADVANLVNNDPCIRMLVLIGHGTESHQFNFCLSNGTRLFRTPQEVASDIPNHHLDHLTVFSCYASGWEEWFSDTHMNYSSKNIDGMIDYGIVFGDLWVSHGVDMKPCTNSPQALFLAGSIEYPQSFLGLNLSENECPSFQICDSSGCSDEIYPVYSCKDSVGLASFGIFSISGTDGMFEVAVHLPNNCTDSVLCAATYYQAVPDTLMKQDARSLGRFLMFINAEVDSSITADSLSVVMKYLESDVASAGIEDESRLGIFWLAPDNPDFQFVHSTLDTAENSLVFTVPQWGMAGIYEIESETGVPDAHKPDETSLWLGQNHPNPFNPSTTIRYHIAQACHIRVEVYDPNGKQVAVLVDAVQDEGPHSVVWDATNERGQPMASGVYFYRLMVGKQMISKKMVLLR
jgi:hypothetical protein